MPNNRKVGRPKKEESRVNTITVRLTDEEMEMLRYLNEMGWGSYSNILRLGLRNSYHVFDLDDD